MNWKLDTEKTLDYFTVLKKKLSTKVYKKKRVNRIHKFWLRNHL